MMQSSEIKGLAVFSIADGKEIGRVRDLLINAEKKAVDYLVVDIPNWYFGSYVIPFNQAEGIGSDAVMVATEGIVKKLNEEQAGIKLVEKGINLIGNRVLTQKGRIIGKISEYHINEDTGQITGCELVDTNNSPRGIIPAQAALTFGKDALIVKNEVESLLVANISDYENPTAAAPVAAAASDAVVEESEQAANGKAVEMFEQRQREYLLGKVSKADITDADGRIIVLQGETITKEIIDRVIAADKMKDLMINV
ncbi:MAG: PRC-barrel domain-containing protein [Syntrophomonadaceae bacterium]